MTKPKRPTDTARAKLAAVVSDIHLPHPAPAYLAFKAWCQVNHPDHIVALGDLVDMAMVSRHPKSTYDPQFVVDELGMCAWEANELLAATERLTMVPGNHCGRLEAYLRGATPHVTKGLKGLTLHEQLRSLGLDPRIEWYEERVGYPGVVVGNVVLRHGHKQQSGKFSGGVNVASTRLNKSLGTNELVGHHHLASMQARAAHGKTAFVVTNPAMAAMQDYAGSDMAWVNGFSILELRPPAFDVATPYVVI
jgi:predicted phosphodiesterase